MEDLLTEKWGGMKLNKDDINNMNQVIILTKSTVINISPFDEYIYYTNLDLHNKEVIFAQQRSSILRHII